MKEEGYRFLYWFMSSRTIRSSRRHFVVVISLHTLFVGFVYKVNYEWGRVGELGSAKVKKNGKYRQ
jgi:hypothetical protein